MPDVTPEQVIAAARRKKYSTGWGVVERIDLHYSWPENEWEIFVYCNLATHRAYCKAPTLPELLAKIQEAK